MRGHLALAPHTRGLDHLPSRTTTGNRCRDEGRHLRVQFAVEVEGPFEGGLAPLPGAWPASARQHFEFLVEAECGQEGRKVGRAEFELGEPGFYLRGQVLLLAIGFPVLEE